MLFLRSALFNALFYLNLVAWMLLALPTFLMPAAAIQTIAKGWARSSLWLLRIVAGIRVEFRGRERIPAGGLIVAAKHQSMWETFALYPEFADTTFILKRELMWIPLFGWYVAKARQVPIDRGARSQAIARLNERAGEALREGRQILIFPEGTRRPVGAEPRYKWGAVHLYAATGAPMLPVALNSGLFWPRRQFLRRPGTIVVEYLEPIPPGLPKEEAFALLQDRIESATARLIAEGRAAMARKA